MKFKVGDRVKQLFAVGTGQSPYAKITRITGIAIWHVHDDESSKDECFSYESQFKLISRDEIIYD